MIEASGTVVVVEVWDWSLMGCVKSLVRFGLGERDGLVCHNEIGRFDRRRLSAFVEICPIVAIAFGFAQGCFDPFQQHLVRIVSERFDNSTTCRDSRCFLSVLPLGVFNLSANVFDGGGYIGSRHLGEHDDVTRFARTNASDADVSGHEVADRLHHEIGGLAEFGGHLLEMIDLDLGQ